jgi:hypothetical protein
MSSEAAKKKAATQNPARKLQIQVHNVMDLLSAFLLMICIYATQVGVCKRMLKEVAAYGRNSILMCYFNSLYIVLYFTICVHSFTVVAEAEVLVNEARVQRMRDENKDIYSIRKQVS